LLAEIHEQQRRFARLGPLSLLERQVALVLRRLNVPSKGEIDGLAEKVEVLSQKVEQLRRLLKENDSR
jgi:polyhydroxyalkanoate synthesis regulator phasin